MWSTRLVGGCERAVEVLLPDQLAARDVDAEQIVGDAGDDRDLARASRRRHALGDERREEVVHLARRAVELDLPQQLHVLDVGEGEDLLVLHPAGTARIDAFGQVVGRHERDAGREHRQAQDGVRVVQRLGVQEVQGVHRVQRWSEPFEPLNPLNSLEREPRLQAGSRGSNWRARR